jgi:CHAT domain-containing protein
VRATPIALGAGVAAALALQLPAPATAAETAPAIGGRCADPGEASSSEREAAPKEAGPALTAATEARSALEAGHLEGLEPKLARARALAGELPEPRERAQVLIHLGRTRVLLADRQPGAGSASLLRAADAYREAAESAAEADDPRLRSYALGYLGELYERSGRWGEALELTRRALFAAQTADAPDAIYRWQWQLARIHGAAGNPDLALADYRQAVATLGKIRDELALTATARETDFRAEVEPIYLGLVDLLLRRSAAKRHADEKQELLAEARNTVEDWKAAELRDYFRDACLDAQRKATPDAIAGAVVVYPIALPDRLELIVSDGGRLESTAVPVDRERFLGEVRSFRRKLEKRTTRQYLRHARTLYDWLIRPIEPAFEQRPIEALVFVPGGALRTIPLAALNDEKSGKFLIEKYPVAITPGLTLTEPRPINRAAVHALAAGITEPVQGFPALDAVGREIETLETVFPAETLVNDQFVVTRFEDEIRGQPFGIVHIATHGEFTADASESFLLAYDQKLSMDRLTDLVATTRFRERQPLELLALSACQTATGDDRAALGLAGVALRAGARSALATLWSVNDQASSDLVSEFYTQLGSPGLSRARALQRAQVKQLRIHHYRHPSYWSPFLLISSWL